MWHLAWNICLTMKLQEACLGAGHGHLDSRTDLNIKATRCASGAYGYVGDHYPTGPTIHYEVWDLTFKPFRGIGPYQIVGAGTKNRHSHIYNTYTFFISNSGI